MDLGTLMFANWMLVACSAGVLAWMSLGQPRLKGLHWMARAMAAAAVGGGLILLTGHLPAWVTSLAGNLLFVAALAMIHRGLASLVSRQPRVAGLDLALFAALLAWLAWFTYRADIIEWRMIGVWMAVAGELAIGYFVVASTPTMRGVPRRPTLAWLASFGVYNVARAFGTGMAYGNRTAQMHFQAVAAAIQIPFTALLALGSVYLAMSEMNEQLEGQTRLDALTGLLNRRALRQALAREMGTSERNGAPLAVLILDLDHFKRINDTMGHAAGDAALTALAMVLSDGVRARDVVARTGGEEFVILLPGQDAATAFGTAERLRRAVENFPFASAAVSLRLTTSVGVATWHGEAESVEALMGRADAALYSAKHAGRNCTVAAKAVAGPEAGLEPAAERLGARN